MRTYVPACGSLDSSVVIVGEQPGRHEVQGRTPFIGASGALLRKILASAGIYQDDVYFTNVIKDLDHPLDYYIKLTKKGAEFSDAGKAYLDFLFKEIKELTQPKVIIAVGNVALFALTGRWGITKWRGSILDYPDRNCKLVSIIHPATCLPPKSVFTNRWLILRDLKRAKQVLDGTIVYDNYNLIIEPTYEKTMNVLSVFESLGLDGSLLGFDIEITGTQEKTLSCISFALGTDSISIPFVCKNANGNIHIGMTQDYFSIERETVVLDKINSILSNRKIRKVGQNVAFDAHFLLRMYGIKVNNMEDTMVAQHRLMPTFPKGLDFITSLWTTIPYYKADGKSYIKGNLGGDDIFWRYNALDSLVCVLAFAKQEELLHRTENWEAYRRGVDQIETLVFMQEFGIRVDLERMRTLAETYSEQQIILQAEIVEQAGYALNPNSRKQVLKYLYEDRGYSVQLNKQRKIAADKGVLKRFARGTENREPDKVISNVLKARQIGKVLSTYLNTDKVDKDSRLRCFYNPAGTRFERLSSSENIFGTGANTQNWPHKVLSMLLPEEGHIYVAYDLSQAENRIVAYVANCTAMINAFESGQDVHSLTANMIMLIYYDNNVPEGINVKSLAPIGDGSLTWRDWGKRANHGLNYDFHYKNFALLYEIPEVDARFIVESYHKMYPEVRQMFHAYVKHCLGTSRIIPNLMGWNATFFGDVQEEYAKGYASIPQGTVGGIMAQALINYARDTDLFEHLIVLIQIHDCLGFSVKRPENTTELKELASRLLKLKGLLEIPLTTHLGKTFVIPADLTISTTLNKEDGFDIKASKIPNDSEAFSTGLNEKLALLEDKRCPTLIG